MESKEMTFAEVLDSLNAVETRMSNLIHILRNWESIERSAKYSIKEDEIPMLVERLGSLHGGKQQYEEYLRKLVQLSPVERPFYSLCKDVVPVVEALHDDANYIVNNNSAPLAKKMLALRELYNELMELWEPICRAIEQSEYALLCMRNFFAISANFRFVIEGLAIQEPAGNDNNNSNDTTPDSPKKLTREEVITKMSVVVPYPELEDNNIDYEEHYKRLTKGNVIDESYGEDVFAYCVKRGNIYDILVTPKSKRESRKGYARLYMTDIAGCFKDKVKRQAFKKTVAAMFNLSKTTRLEAVKGAREGYRELMKGLFEFTEK